jgi:hypothetical protein
MAKKLATAVPQLHGAIVLVDSPRWPSDLDWSKPGVVAAADCHRGREIDFGLRALVIHLRELGANSALAPLSMFPTPALRYFGAHLNAAACKPHLRALGRALFGGVLDGEFGPAAGGIFTRFMIAGFAAYRALEAIGADIYECYPDLQFKLWCGQHRLSSKNSTGRGGRAAALTTRVSVLRSLARTLGVGGCGLIRRLDEADGAILALSVTAARRRGATIIFEKASEGRFMVALNPADAQRFRAGYETITATDLA